MFSENFALFTGGEGQRFSVDSLLPKIAYKLRCDTHAESETFKLSHRIDREATGILLISRYVPSELYLLLLTHQLFILHL